MAEIVPFSRPDTKRAHPLPGRTAQIVIFPGIRVEYHAEAVVSDPQPADDGGSRGGGSRKPSRRRLSA